MNNLNAVTGLSPVALVSTGAVTLLTVLWLGGLVRRLLPATPRTRIVEPARPGQTAVYRSLKAPADGPLPTYPHPEVTTLFELANYAARCYGDKDFIGARPLIKVHVDEKQVRNVVNGVEKMETKKWTFYEMGGYSYMSYRKFIERRNAIGAGLVKSGAKPGVTKAGLYCATRPEWLLFAHGCFSQSIAVATVYANLGEEGLLYAINEGELELLFTSADLFPSISSVLERAKSLKWVVFVDEPAPEAKKNIMSTRLLVYSLTELEATGVANPAAPLPPKPNDVAVIMYTSGSTGNPKGVMLTHANLISAITGARLHLRNLISSKDYYLAFLPQAHVLELMVEHVLMFFGVTLGYGSPRTLTDVSIRNCKSDIQEFRPSILAGVPTVWETIRKGALHRVETGPAINRFLFRLAFATKLAHSEGRIPVFGGVLSYLFDKIVFSKFRANVGGRPNFFVAGGAPLSKETHQFLRICMGRPFIQGYGLTETCGITTAQDETDEGYMAVGIPMPVSEVKLVDIPDMNYFSTDKPHPRGELLARGPSIAAGYYKLPKQSAEAFQDGWLLTGDVATINPDGSFRIIDRKKNLVKLAHGEYIALEKLESLYKDSIYVTNICIYADGTRDFPIALVFPAARSLLLWAERTKGIQNPDLARVCALPEAQKLVLDSLHEVAKKGGLKGIELVQRVILTPEEWTPENELLTAAMKLKRQNLTARFRKEIDAAYAAGKQ